MAIKRRTQRLSTQPIFPLLILVCIAACGCSGSESGGGGNRPTPTEGALYVLSTRVTTGAELATFAVVVDSLESGTEVDFGSAIEVPNGGVAVGPALGEVLYAVDGATPQLTEFRLQDDGSFDRGETLSLRNVSLTTQRVAAGNFVFI